MIYLRRIAPWLVLGPITGALAEGLYRNVRARNPVLASLYGVAIGATWVDLALYGARAIASFQ